MSDDVEVQAFGDIGLERLIAVELLLTRTIVRRVFAAPDDVF
jgi:hypothetical protein